MERETLIAFLKFIGIESVDLEQHIRESRFCSTSVVLGMAALKVGESEGTIKDWYTQFSNMQETDSNFIEAIAAINKKQ